MSVAAFYKKGLDPLDVDRLIEYVTKLAPAKIRAFPDITLPLAQQDTLTHLVARRLQGEPIAYLTQTQGFWDLNLRVNEHTLIPRPETELLVEYLLRLWDMDTTKTVLDVGTGSGAIALSFGFARPLWQVWGTDVSSDALTVARHNGKWMPNVQFLEGSWFTPVAGQRFDAVVSNPPYIGAHEPHPQEGDCRFEPQNALIAGETGLEALFHLIEEAPHYLNPMGWLVLEHGYQQQPAVLERLKARGFRHLTAFQDYNRQPRLCVGQWGDT